MAHLAPLRPSTCVLLRRKIRAVSKTDAPIDLSPSDLGVPPPAHAAIVRWLTEATYAEFHDELKAEVDRAVAGDTEARASLADAFEGPLPIGTGGRRGLVGPGPNRINPIVLRETARGLVAAMRDEGVPMKVAVAFDTRRDSHAFARVVSRQLASDGVSVLLIDAARPTPQLSYVVRDRGCGAGIVISASHNPPGDNGIKIYGPDGAQVLGARDKALMAAIRQAMTEALPPLDPDADARIELLPLAEVDAAYHQFIRDQGVAPAETMAGAGLSVVFTPLHGVGHTAVVPALQGTGVELHLVERQCDPDGGRFSTVRSANPESPESMELGRQLAEEKGAQLVIATDPDADRLGALALDGDGKFQAIDGNRLGVLMFDHVLRHAERPPNAWVLTTLVTTPLIGIMARDAGIEVVDDLLVGFKHHAGMQAEQPDKTVFFGCEESHGFMRGDHVHDKDGAVAARLLVEAAAMGRSEGLTLFGMLERVWCQHGYHRERTENLYAHGAAGREAIGELMRQLRAHPPPSVAGLKVVRVEDRTVPRNTGSVTRDLPGNVLLYDLEGTRGGRKARCRLTVRPSGTEPKAKVYALAGSEGGLEPSQIAAVQAEVDGLVDDVLAEARARAEAIMASVLRS